MTLTQCRERKRILTSRVHCSIPKTGWYFDGVGKNTTHSSPVVSTCRFNSMCLKINSNSSTYCDHFIFVSGATYHVVFFICLGDTAYKKTKHSYRISIVRSSEERIRGHITSPYFQLYRNDINQARFENSKLRLIRTQLTGSK